MGVARAVDARRRPACASGRPRPRSRAFESVYRAVPGELAPKLALGVATEIAGQPEAAAPLVRDRRAHGSRVHDRCFGLARCRAACRDRAGALAAYSAVPATSRRYDDAQLARIALPARRRSRAPRRARRGRRAGDAQPRRRAADPADGAACCAPRSRSSGGVPADPATTLLGVALTERDLRRALERSYRALAHHTDDRDERIRLVDAANAVRPRTWT